MYWTDLSSGRTNLFGAIYKCHVLERENMFKLPVFFLPWTLFNILLLFKDTYKFIVFFVVFSRKSQNQLIKPTNKYENVGTTNKVETHQKYCIDWFIDCWLLNVRWVVSTHWNVGYLVTSSIYLKVKLNNLSLGHLLLWYFKNVILILNISRILTCLKHCSNIVFLLFGPTFLLLWYK